MAQFTVSTWAASSEFNASYSADNAGDERFSAAANERWAASGAAPHWLRADLGTAQTATWYRVDPGRSGNDPVAWTFQGTNDGTFASWTTLDTQTGQSWENQTKTYTFANSTAYRYYRMNITSGSSVAELEIGDGTPHAEVWEHLTSSVALASGDFTTGLLFQVNSPIDVTHLSAYVGSANGTYSLRIRDSSGAVVASASYVYTTADGTGWRAVAITPVTLAVGDYMVEQYSTGLRRSVRSGNHAADVDYGTGAEVTVPQKGTVTFRGNTYTSRFAAGNAEPSGDLGTEAIHGFRFVAASAPSGVTGTLGVTDHADTATISGTVSAATITGALSVTDHADTAVISGTTAAPTVSGALNVTDHADEAILGGEVEGLTAGSFEVTDHADEVVISGDVTVGDNVLVVVDHADEVVIEAVTEIDAVEFYPFRSQARMGYLTIPIPLPPPAHVDPVKVARHSHVAPALSEANPILTEGVDYPHADAVEVGTWHVFVAGVDVTYLGGAPIQSTRRSSRSPMGDVSATFEIPAMQAWTEPGEGDLYMLQPDAPVDMVLVDDLGNQTHLWRGFLSSVTSSVDATSETPTKSHTFIADGTLWQAGYALHEPPHYLPPTDIGTLIPDALNKVPGKRWSDIPRVTTGRTSRNRGSGNQSVMQWVDELLQKDGLEDNGGQWTLVEIAPGEFRLQLKAETTTYDYSVTYGAFGIEVDLTRDESMRVDVIYGRGIETNGGQWRGTRFPGLVIATPPPYPNDPPTSLHLGDSDADTDSGDGVTLWQRRMVELGYTLTVDGVLNSNDIQVVRRLQARMGALVDGVIGPQTWAASFNRGPEGIDLTQWREPIAALPWTQEFYRDPSGIIISENPDYDPTRVQHQVEVDFGVNITWREAQPLAERMLEIESVPALTGTIRMVTDFHEAWRGLAKPGDRVRVVGFQGADVIVRVAAVDVSVGDDGMEVLLTVDERSRDAYNVEAILERNRDALPDPNRRPGSPSRASRLVQDRYVQWDIDSPCGFMPRTAVFGGLWVCPNPIPFAEVGRVVKTMLTCTVPFTLALFGLPVKPSQLHSTVGDPHTQDDPWVGEARVAALDALGWIESWGSQGERCGYSPNGQESQGATFTGKFKEVGGFDFISGHPPYVWPALFSSTTGFIGGAEAGGWGRFYPDTSV